MLAPAGRFSGSRFNAGKFSRQSNPWSRYKANGHTPKVVGDFKRRAYRTKNGPAGTLSDLGTFSRAGLATMVDASVRAESEADWVQGAVFYGLLVEHSMETGVAMVPAPGVEVDVLGPVQTSPAIVDAQMNVLSPASFDLRYHLNLRIHGPALDKTVEGTDFPKWKQMVINWTKFGDDDIAPNVEEKAVVLHNVALIDPDSIKSPSRVWL